MYGNYERHMHTTRAHAEKSTKPSEREKGVASVEMKFLCELELTLVCVFFLLLAFLDARTWNLRGRKIWAFCNEKILHFFLFWFDLFGEINKIPGKFLCFIAFLNTFFNFKNIFFNFLKHFLFKKSPTSFAPCKFLYSFNPLNFPHHLLPFRFLVVFF